MSSNFHPDGTLFIVSGPSGAGKTTLINRVRGQLPEVFASERGLKTTNRLRGEVSDWRGRARLDDVEVEPRLQHELELFFPVRDGEITRAVGHG